ncbi:MAG: hypothetical protein O7G87_00495 [bacterium]|nr:hypothetical protein [bacterium]
MFKKIRDGFALLVSHLGLFAAIVLTIRLPGNAVANYLDEYVFDPKGMEALQVNAGIEWVFGPLYVGAVVYAASRLLQQEEVRYGEAMGVGFRNWFFLWLAWLGAGLLIGVGLLLLVVPGIVLAVRYALIDSVVILNGPGPPVAWKRSNALTKGSRWPILGASVVFLMGFGLLWWLMEALVEELVLAGVIGLMGKVVMHTVWDCMLDVLLSGVAIVMLLFYLEAQQKGTSE